MLYYFLLIVVWFFILPKSAHAYLDPGTGSYLIQIFIGLLLGGMFFLRSFFKSFFLQIRDFFKKPQKRIAKPK
jgi:hypothetical protein